MSVLLKWQLLATAALFSVNALAVPPTKSDDFGSQIREHEEKTQLEQQLRQVRIAAKVREEEDRLERERQQKAAEVEKQRTAATNQPPQGHGAMPNWNQISSGTRYQALNDEEKAKLKAKYFDEVIAPLTGGQVAAMRETFLGHTPEWFQSAKLAWSGAIMALLAAVYVVRAKITKLVHLMLSKADSVLKLTVAGCVVAIVMRLVVGGPIVLFVR